MRGGPGSEPRLRPRLSIGRDAVGCPGAPRGQSGRGRGLPARARPAPAPAPLVPSPAWAAGVFKVGGQPREPDIRERPAALLRRPPPSRPALLSRPYNPRQCPETVWSSQPRCPPGPGLFQLPSLDPLLYFLKTQESDSFSRKKELRSPSRCPLFCI